MTSAPCRLFVLMRPPSLEPSTPDVREPRDLVTRELSPVLRAPFHSGEDRLHCGLVAEPAGIQDQVVVTWQIPGVAVNLSYVRAAVLVGLLNALTRLVFRDVLTFHDRLHPCALVRPEEDVQRSLQIAQHVRAAPTDDHYVARTRRLPDDLLRVLQDGAARVALRVG